MNKNLQLSNILLANILLGKPLLWLFLVFLCSNHVVAQSQAIDSLKQLANSLPRDTAKIAPLNNLATALSRISPKEGLPYAIEATNIARDFKDEKKLAASLTTKGVLFQNTGASDSALNCYAESMKLYEKLKDKVGVARCYTNIGNVYVNYLKNTSQGLEYYQKALEVFEDIGDERRAAMLKNNIGLAYVSIAKETNNPQKYIEAINLLNQSLQTRKRLKDTKGVASVQNSLGDAYKAKGDYIQAVYFYNQSNNGANASADRLLLVDNLNSIGEVYHLQGQYKQAIPFLQQGVSIAKMIGSKDQLEKFYRRLATSYESLKDSAKALRYYKLATVYKDSLYNESGSEQLAQMQATLNSEKQKKEIELLNAQKETDRIIQYAFAAIFVLVLVIIIAGLVTLSKIRKKNNRLLEQNEEINAQKEEITQQKDVLEEQSRNLQLANSQILKQKDEVEEKSQRLENANRLVLKQKEEVEEKSRSLEQANRLVLKQKEEVEEKSQSLEQAYTEINAQKNQLSNTLEDVKLLSKVGQELTSSLDFETTFMRLYEYVKDSIPLDCFRVMIYNEPKNVLEDSYSIERGVRLKPEIISLNDPSRLSVICTLQKRDIFIKDYVAEYENYFPGSCLIGADNVPLSIIFLPLIVDDVVEGVISVQSYERNAFDEFNFNLLKNLAAYTAISLDNAKAYMQISDQSKIIEEKNKSITDSLRYAETMQQAMLPAPSLLSNLFAEHFVIFLPKDYVSGDFYWCATAEDKTFAAVVDCTGHGVPGAFMSLIGISLLNEIVKQRNIISPAAILENLHTGVQALLRQEDKTNDDGMDVCICAIERISPFDFLVIFSGAQRPLLYKKQSDVQLQRIKGDRKPIGGWFKGKKAHFTDNELVLRKGDMLYLMSDGFADQDNPEREKFGVERLNTLLESYSLLPMSDQKQELLTELKTFQKNKSQRDDISIMGIKL